MNSKKMEFSAKDGKKPFTIMACSMISKMIAA
jgi:hypothetical protein